MEGIELSTTRRVQRLRPALVKTGLCLLVPSGVYFTLGLLGLVPTEFLAVGSSSGLRTVASVAIGGCLLAAIGYWDE